MRSFPAHFLAPAASDPSGTTDASVMTLRFGGDVDTFRRTEWLLSDGLGGFAMGTALGLNTRRYHGLLISASKPPLGRIMSLSNVLERITLDAGGKNEQTVDISTFEFHPQVLAPRGFDNLQHFEKGLDFVRWTYVFGPWTMQRELRIGWRTGGAALHYRIDGPNLPVRVLLKPLLRLHDFHHLIRFGSEPYRVLGTMAGIQVQSRGHELHLASSAGQFKAEADWWFNYLYREETARGQDDAEDLFTPGFFRHTFEPVGPRTLTLHAGPTLAHVSGPGPSRAPSRSEHLARIQSRIRAAAPVLAADRTLLCASDDFVVPRQVGPVELKTIIAGYPWFADWGRDTMISLPGLLLVTGRFDEALATLRAFAAHLRGGLIPNLFDDDGGLAHYNTVDASLWFIHAACEYRRLSGDHSGFDRDLKAACFDIIAHYRRGTDYGIAMDPADGLIMAGDPDSQLTWMDAKRDGVTFTPRYGKPVEVNALWHHALHCLAGIVSATQPPLAAELRSMAQKAGASLASLFWSEEIACLADCLVPQGDPPRWVQDRSIRPNQLFAVSLDPSPLSPHQQQAVLRAVEHHLLTPVGLRTLSPFDPRYRGRYEGNMFSRDSAYHQGTVWPWLTGAYVEALLRSTGFSDESRVKARALTASLRAEMEKPARTLGQLCEVYDGDESVGRARMPGGAIAQAWSVAELIRSSAMLESADLRTPATGSFTG